MVVASNACNHARFTAEVSSCSSALQCAGSSSITQSTGTLMGTLTIRHGIIAVSGSCAACMPALLSIRRRAVSTGSAACAELLLSELVAATVTANSKVLLIV
jgi:hypothetical protein